MSRVGVEGVSEIPVYAWGDQGAAGYHLNGTVSAAAILQKRVFPSLKRLPAGSEVADFGCGEGRLMKQLRRESNGLYVLRGYELNPAAVARFEAFSRENGGSSDTIEVADLTRLAAGRDRFSAGFLWRVLHSIPQEHHRMILWQVLTTLRLGASLHVAALSERDWKKDELKELGLYQPGRMNNCYPVMEFALNPVGVEDWNLYFFRKGELADLSRSVGFQVVHEESIKEESGFQALRETKPPLSYDYLELQRGF